MTANATTAEDRVAKFGFQLPEAPSPFARMCLLFKLAICFS